MMEIMLMLQPIAATIIIFPTLLLVMCFVGAIITYIAVLVHESDGNQSKDTTSTRYQEWLFAKQTHKAFRKLSIILVIIVLPLVPVAKSWDVYKNMLAYRAINSKTADKAVENADIFMSKLQKYLIEWEPGKTNEQQNSK